MMHYDPDQFKNQMIELGFEDKIKKIFGDELVIYYESFENNDLKKFTTPRQDWIGKKFSAAPLWYLNFLIEKRPKTIVDIGCGMNLFKSVIGKIFNINVYGIDPMPENSAADEINSFDSCFSEEHKNMYESAFSINALHFIPLKDFSTRVKEFYNVIAPGGCGFLALNSERMFEFSDKQWLVDKFSSNRPMQPQIEKYIIGELNTIGIDFIVKDILISKIRDEYMDGNIRLVFEK